MKRHVIFIYKGKVYQSYKNWSLSRTEAVLKRLGATWWEIEI